MDGAELGEGMEIDRVVLPLASSEAAAAATAATGRARFAYLAQTGAKAPPGEAARRADGHFCSVEASLRLGCSLCKLSSGTTRTAWRLALKRLGPHGLQATNANVLAYSCGG